MPKMSAFLKLADIASSVADDYMPTEFKSNPASISAEATVEPGNWH